MKTANWRQLMVDFRLFGILLLLMLALSLVSDRFLTVDNLTNVLWSVCLIGIMSTGAIYAPVTGGIDLSVGSMAALAGIIANVLMNGFGMNWLLALVVTLGVAIIPSLYAWCNILANWDPYANTGNIQVAVANEDKGTTSTLVGHLDAGQQTVNQPLRKDHRMPRRAILGRGAQHP